MIADVGCLFSWVKVTGKLSWLLFYEQLIIFVSQKFQFALRIEFIRSKLSNFLLM